jgi:ribonuclease E
VFSEQCEHCGGRGIVVHTEVIDRSGGSSGGSDQGSSRSGRGRGRTGTAQSGGNGSGGSASPASADESKPSGPTAAQIAAAAHAAALRRSEAGDGVADTSGHAVDGVDGVAVVDGAHLADELAAVAVTTFGGPVDGEAADHLDGEAAGHVDDEAAEEVDASPQAPLEEAADEQADRAEQSVAVATEVQTAVQAHLEPEVDPTAPVARRGRRKRGRVVAPAGPPRATASEDGPGSESAADAAEVPTH